MCKHEEKTCRSHVRMSFLHFRVLRSPPGGLGFGPLFDVTPDGHRFLVSGLHPPSGNIPLTLVENWDAELKKK